MNGEWQHKKEQPKMTRAGVKQKRMDVKMLVEVECRNKE